VADIVFNMQLLALIISRVTAFFYHMPVLGGKYIPNSGKIALGLCLSLVIFPLVPRPSIPAEGPFMIDFGVFMLKEVIVGLSIGLAVSLFINGIRFTGRLIGRNMGLMMANVIDPESGMNVSIIEQINYLFFIFIFLVLNGHYFLVRALVDSYSMVPVGGFKFHADVIELLLKMFNNIFIIGFKIGMPVFGALIINTVMLGIIAKVASKIRILIISFPMRIMTGVIMMALTFSMIMGAYMEYYEEIKIWVYRVIQTMH